MERDEWISPRRFFGVLAATGDLGLPIRCRGNYGLGQSTYDGKSRGSESDGASEGISTRLPGVFVGEELGNAIGDELPAMEKVQPR
jgi:hypothetical protein